MRKERVNTNMKKKNGENKGKIEGKEVKEGKKQAWREEKGRGKSKKKVKKIL